MARIRTIKPEMAQNEDLAECSCWAQLLAVRILNHSDDEGYFKANPALVQSNCFPLIDDESLSIRRILDELSSAGYIELFTGADSKKYGFVVTFSKHQRVDRLRLSTIKELRTIDDESTNPRRILDSGREGNGREWKGMDLEELPLKDGNEWTPDEKFLDEMVKAYPKKNIDSEFQSMRAWLISNPAEQKPKAGIKKFVNGWLKRADDSTSEDEYLRGAI
jgi:hypothetical protein